LRSRHALNAYFVAVLVFLPFPFLTAVYVLPGVVWLAFVGLAVPAALVEGLGLRAALVRGYRLAGVDFVHVLGGLATLALVVFLSQFSLYFVLREYAENTRIVAAALASLLCRRPSRHDLAMTGELTLRGRVLPVGGLREKLTAAARAGVKVVLVPARNQAELADVPDEVTKLIKITPVETIDEVLQHALLEPESRPKATRGTRVTADHRLGGGGTAL